MEDLVNVQTRLITSINITKKEVEQYINSILKLMIFRKNKFLKSKDMSYAILWDMKKCSKSLSDSNKQNFIKK